MTRTLKLGENQFVTIRRADPDVLEVEAAYGPAGAPAPAHFHPAQDEHFEVLEGEIRIRAGGEERDVGQGETIDIPRGTAHQMWNASNRPARVRWETRPAGRTEEWFAILDALQRGEPAPDDLLAEYRDVFRLAEEPGASA
jgi:quercetin dioxygenase-like cupin family protein